MNYKDYKLKEKIKKTWNKGNFSDMELNNDRLAKDYAGAIISFNEYGQQSEYGWEIMHIVPASRTAEYESEYNICPVHWRNLKSKGDNFPEWETIVSSNDNVTNNQATMKWRCVQGLIRRVKDN